jgi:uncharacterized integral membrane protein
MPAERPPTSQNPPNSGDDASAPPDEPAATPCAEQQRTPVKPPRTRVSAAFNGFVAGAIVLMLLLIFILENTRSVKITFLGASGHLALGIALLLAAVGGALVVGVLGTARITQVRRHAKRHG